TFSKVSHCCCNPFPQIWQLLPSVIHERIPRSFPCALCRAHPVHFTFFCCAANADWTCCMLASTSEIHVPRLCWRVCRVVATFSFVASSRCSSEVHEPFISA